MTLQDTLRAAFTAASLRVFVPVEPMPAPRPRFTRTGFAFMPQEYQLCSAKMLDVFLRTIPPGTVHDGPVALLIESVRKRPKSTKLATPRGDTDNLAKTPMDALTKSQRVWVDDNQVVALVSTKRWTRPGEEAGVHIALMPLTEEDCQ